MFLKKQPKLLLAVLIGAAVVNISRAKVQGILSINNWMWSKKQKIVKGLWREQTVLIINKINMMSPKLLATVDVQLSLAKEKPNTDITVYGRLAIIILMKNFY